MPDRSDRANAAADTTEFDPLPDDDIVPMWTLWAIVLGLTALTGSLLVLAIVSIAVVHVVLARADAHDGVRRTSPTRRRPR